MLMLFSVQAFRKTKTQKKLSKAAQYKTHHEEIARKGFHETLTIRPWFIQHNKPLFDGKVGDAHDQSFKRVITFAPWL